MVRGAGEAGVLFVSRRKENAVQVERRRVRKRCAVRRDEVSELTGAAATAGGPHRLRRVEVDGPDKGGTLVFVTNHLALGATTTAAIDKDRWQIELFLNALEEQLRIKTFVGTSANGLKAQAWTALIARLFRTYLQSRSCFAQLPSRFARSRANLAALLRTNLFTHRDLWTWLHQSFEGTPSIIIAS